MKSVSSTWVTRKVQEVKPKDVASLCELLILVHRIGDNGDVGEHGLRHVTS